MSNYFPGLVDFCWAQITYGGQVLWPSQKNEKSKPSFNSPYVFLDFISKPWYHEKHVETALTEEGTASRNDVIILLPKCKTSVSSKHHLPRIVFHIRIELAGNRFRGYILQEPGNLFLIPGILPCVGSHRVALLQNVPMKFTWMIINVLPETKSSRLLL